MARTLNEHFNSLNKKNQKISQTLTQIGQLNGLSIDIFDSIDVYQSEYSAIHNELHQKWSEIQQAQRQGQQGSDFETYDNRIAELFEKVTYLYREATSQNVFSNRISNIKEIDTSKFNEALKYHRQQSTLHLILLGVLVATAIFTIASIFTFKNSELFPGNFVKLLETSSSYRTLIVLILIQLGGKITVIIGLAWLFKFIGGLHSKHSQQAIIYQDRIAGLSASELIITSARTSIRDLVLKQMTETFLSDKENAFKETKEKIVEESVTKKDLMTLVKSTLELTKK